MMTNTKMSVFNKYTSPQKQVKYIKHVVDNVFWDDERSVQLSTGNEKDDKVVVFIPKDKNDFSGYVKPKEYDGTNWTLDNGSYIVKGETSENEVSTLKELSSKYNEVAEITSVIDRDFGSYSMQHFEIRGK